jgi:hypothetical protein
MNEAAEAESKRYRDAIEQIIIRFVDKKINKLRFIGSFVRETNRHYMIMYMLGGGEIEGN